MFDQEITNNDPSRRKSRKSVKSVARGDDSLSEMDSDANPVQGLAAGHELARSQSFAFGGMEFIYVMYCFCFDMCVCVCLCVYVYV